MSWPAARTVPADGEAFIGWALAVASLMAYAALPILAGYLHVALSWSLGVSRLEPSGVALVDALRLGLMVVAFSPLFSWGAILLALPVAAIALHRGWARWAVAVCAGALVGQVAMVPVLILMEASRAAHPATALSVGAVLGGAFWLGLRLAAPRLFRTSPPNAA